MITMTTYPALRGHDGDEHHIATKKKNRKYRKTAKKKENTFNGVL